MDIIKAWKDDKVHYTVEFQFNGERYYVIHNYSAGYIDFKVVTEQEFLLADEPEAIYKVSYRLGGEGVKVDGVIPDGMSGELVKAMEAGNKAAKGEE